MNKENRYTATFRANGQTIMHWHGEDQEKMLLNMLSLLEFENSSTSAELLDNKTNQIIFTSKKSAIS